MGLKWFLAAFALLFCVGSSHSLNISRTIRLDQKPLYFIDKFSFMPGGTIKTSMSHDILPKEWEKARLGLVAVITNGTEPTVRFSGHYCPLTSTSPNLLAEVGRDSTIKSFPFVGDREIYYEVTKETRGAWFVYFAICGCVPTGRTITVSLSLANVDPTGDNTYLSAEELNLPSVCFIIASFNFALLAIWVRVMRSARPRERFPLHWALFCLLLLITVSSFGEAIVYWAKGFAGKNLPWSAISSFLLALVQPSLFIFIVLCGDDSQHRYNNHNRKRWTTWTILTGLELVFGILEAMVFNARWSNLVQVMDVLCCIAMVILLHPLHSTTIEAEKTPRKIFRLECLISIHAYFTGYIFVTRVLTTRLATLLPLNSSWIPHIIDELGLLVLLSVIAYKVAPGIGNPLFGPLVENKEI